MATRLYFPAACPATVAPAANGSWGYTSEVVNRHLATGKTGTALTDGVRVGPWTVGPTTALGERYVSPPLRGSQTISGTIKLYLRTREYATADNVTSQLEAYVVSNDGATVRGTLLAIANYGSTNELNTANRSKAFADGDAISSVDALDGDRIVICPGFVDQASAATPEGSNNYGDDFANTDLPENETQTTAGIGWVEFSATLTFKGATVTRVEFVLFNATAVASVGFTSRTPTANALQVAIVSIEDLSDTLNAATPCTMAGNGLNWKLEGDQQVDWGAGRSRISVFSAIGTAPTAGVAACTFPQNCGCAAILLEFPGASAFKQVKFATAVGTDPTLALDATAIPDNALLSCFVLPDGSAAQAPRTGWGEVYDDGDGTEVQFRQNATESTGSSTSTTTGNWLKFVGEITKKSDVFALFQSRIPMAILVQ